MDETEDNYEDRPTSRAEDGAVTPAEHISSSDDEEEISEYVEKSP